MALRRVSLRSGLRGAALDTVSNPIFLSSVYMQTDADWTVLAGLTAATHLHFVVEASWAFQALSLSGNPFRIAVGFSAGL